MPVPVALGMFLVGKRARIGLAVIIRLVFLKVLIQQNRPCVGVQLLGQGDQWAVVTILLGRLRAV